LDEGLHDTVPMPPMPIGDPWPAIRQLVSAESELRLGNTSYIPPPIIDSYWADLITLLRAYAIRKGNLSDLESLLADIHFNPYRLYILDRIAKRKLPAVTRDFFKSDVDDAARSA
jgi:thymidylate synthase